MQEKIAELLSLTGDERCELYNRAEDRRGEPPKDIADYLVNNKTEIENLRERMRA